MDTPAYQLLGQLLASHDPAKPDERKRLEAEYRAAVLAALAEAQALERRRTARRRPL